jgi:hypothetical protein
VGAPIISRLSNISRSPKDPRSGDLGRSSPSTDYNRPSKVHHNFSCPASGPSLHGALVPDRHPFCTSLRTLKDPCFLRLISFPNLGEILQYKLFVWSSVSFHCLIRDITFGSCCPEETQRASSQLCLTSTFSRLGG